MSKIGYNYTKKELDQATLDMIKEGKDIVFTYKGRKFILDIKEYEAKMRFERPDLFTNGK